MEIGLFPGIWELAILVGLGGGAGLPLGIPPASEEPLMSNVAPDECLFYTSWAGTADPDPASTNQTEQLLAESEVQQMIGDIRRHITSGLRQAVQNDGPEARQIIDDALQWGQTLLVRPTAVFVSGVTLGHAGPTIEAGALVCLDEDAAKLKVVLEKYQQMFLRDRVQPVQIGLDTWYGIKVDPKVPEITWGVKGRYFIVGVGQGAIEKILANARTPMPTWLGDARQQLPVERVSTVTYVNLDKIINTLVPLAGLADGPQIKPVLDAIGLGDVGSLVSVTGLDETGFVKHTLLSLNGEPQGLLSFAAADPLGPDDLAPIPRDATVALAARVDVAEMFEAVLSVVEKIEPRARGDLLEELGDVEQELGFNLRSDLLPSLGDVWCVYNSPGEGGLVITGLTAVVKIEDRRSLADINSKLLALAKAEMERGGDPRRDPRIEQFQFAGQTVYFFDARDDEFPVAPAWCLTEQELVVATFPQNIKAYLSRGDDFESLATAPDVAGLFQASGGPVALSYCDTPKLFELIYPLVPGFAQVVMSELQREGIDVNVSILPSAKAIGKHLRPTVAFLRRSEAGIEVISRQSLPGGSIGTVAPMMFSMGVPAVFSARQSAQRVAGMNNLKQIGLATHMYSATHGAFPPAFSTDEEGKPLLSWRVLILPFLEGQGLYEQFHLDEPWDSEHNKTLIEKMPAVYRAPGRSGAPGATCYMTIRGKDTVFPGEEEIKMDQITDGHSKTVMVAEVGSESVVWTKPDDFVYDEDNDPAARLANPQRGGFNAVFCDGHVQFIGEMIDPSALNALFTRHGGEEIDHGEF